MHLVSPQDGSYRSWQEGEAAMCDNTFGERRLKTG
jgi:hypothetical protein